MRRRKLTIIILFCLFCMGSMLAQHQESSMLREGRTWRVLRKHSTHSSENHWMTIDTCTYRQVGDTLMEGLTYHRLFLKSKYQYLDEEWHYFAGVREVDGRVFIVNEGERQERLLYDFHLKNGATIQAYDTTMSVLDVQMRSDSQGRWHTCVTLTGTPQVFRDDLVWVEGIGCANMRLLKFVDPFSPCWHYIRQKVDGDMREQQMSIFLSCEDQDTCVYQYTDFDSMFPLSPMDNVRDVRTVRTSAPSQLFDLQGRPVTTPPARGIYIKDGKKYYVK